MKTRRQFLKSASAALLGTALVPAALVEASRRPVARNAPLRELNYAAFAACVATAFHVREDGRPILLWLDQARLASGSRGECFTLTFCGPTERLLGQGTYDFEHDQLGALRIFIVPGGRLGSSPCYHAVFNRCA